MKIGIVTLYNADYGSYYQAVSLYDQLKKMGHTCELIHILNRECHVIKNCGGWFVAKYLPFIAGKIAEKIDPYRTYIALTDSLREYKISDITFSMRRISAQYDCIVVGADELWSAMYPYVKYIRTYYGYHMKCPHISYATSGLNLGNPPQKILEQIRMDLSSFSAISVRDITTQEWVQKLIHKDCTIVMDPTLLNPFFTQKTVEGDYLLVYGEHFSPPQVDAITAFAKKKGLHIKCVSWKHSWCEFVQVESPQDMIALFAQSAWCISSTFHGTIFSILHKKNFTAFYTEARGKKVKNLLSELQLEDRLYKSGKIPDIPVDYKPVEILLDENRAYAMGYLTKALNDVERKLNI